ncbi:MAG: DEAD/DEAH box helicase [Sphaerochaetaceae bacterium]
MTRALYQWQRECITAWRENGGRGIVQVVTGGGKTLMAITAAKELDQALKGSLVVKIVVPTTFLVDQWQSALQSCGIARSDIGTYYSKNKDKKPYKYKIYVINSARYVLAREILAHLSENGKILLIADECHHYGSVENRKIFDFLGATNGCYYTLGLSATPQGSYFETVLKPALGSLVYRYSFKEAVKHRIVTTYALFYVDVEFSDKEQDDYEALSRRISLALRKGEQQDYIAKKGSEVEFFHRLALLCKHSDLTIATWAQSLLALLYKRSAILYLAKNRVLATLTLVKRLSKQSKIIIFGERIEQGDELFTLLNREYPHKVGRYHSAMGPTARQFELKQFRDNQSRILISCRALDEGFDLPQADVGIILSSSTTERQKTQRLGRILRPDGTKRFATLYYIYVGGSREENPLLNWEEEHPFELYLSFNATNKSFSHPLYDRLSLEVLKDLEHKGINTKQRETILALLNKGQVRSDWFQKSPEQNRQIYWLLMDKIYKKFKKDI